MLVTASLASSLFFTYFSLSLLLARRRPGVRFRWLAKFLPPHSFTNHFSFYSISLAFQQACPLIGSCHHITLHYNSDHLPRRNPHNPHSLLNLHSHHQDIHHNTRPRPP